VVADADDHYPDWEAVYAHNAVRVYRMVFAGVGNLPDAEDLTAEVFLTALKPLRMIATTAEVRGYLRATTRTVLAAHRREAMRARDHVDRRRCGLAHNRPQATSTAPQQARILLAARPDNYRRILELRFLQGCSVKDSATQMGISVANAKVLQHRALPRRSAKRTNNETSVVCVATSRTCCADLQRRSTEWMRGGQHLSDPVKRSHTNRCHVVVGTSDDRAGALGLRCNRPTYL
jgi:RNA polymerase sigma factor (sigma-70 family)